MAQMARVRAVLSNWVGGPGLATFYFAGPGNVSGAEALEGAARVRAFFNGAVSSLLANVQVQVSNQVDVLLAETGELVGGFTVAAQALVTGSSAADAYSPAICALVKHETGVFEAGRRVTGRTFIGPLSEAIVTSGTFNNAASLKTAADLLTTQITTAVGQVVWHRPKPVSPTNPVFVNGSSALVSGHSVPTKLAVLRSRRD